LSGDGASFGISAGKALKVIMGGEQPEKKDRRTPNEMRLILLGSKHPDEFYDKEGIEGYSNAAAYCGKLLLELFERHPELAHVPMASEYELDEELKKTDWTAAWNQRKIIREGLDDVIARTESDFMQKTYDLGLTGFQWGWAVNAARYAMDIPPTSNPALLTIKLNETKGQ